MIIQKTLNYDAMLFRGRDYNNYENNSLQHYISPCFVCHEECVIVLVLSLYPHIAWRKKAGTNFALKHNGHEDLSVSKLQLV